MSFIGDSRRKNGPGIVPVQDTSWSTAGWKPQMRASLIGCRVTNRKLLDGDLGHYEHEHVGDFGFGQLWEKTNRFADQWRWGPFGVLTVGSAGSGGSGGGGSITPGGNGGGGGGPTTPGSGPPRGEVPADSRTPGGTPRAATTPSGSTTGGITGGVTTPGSGSSTTTGTGSVPVPVTTGYAAPDADLRPARDKRWTTDQELKQIALPGKAPGWPSIPGGIVGTTTTATRVDKEELLFVWGDPRLIAANRGFGAYGSLVCDITGSDVDKARSAPLQSALTVIRGLGAGILSTAGSRVNCLARTMTLSGQKDVLGGLSFDGVCVSRDTIADGGYHDCGSKTDKHILARDADGHPCNPAHLATHSFFRGVGDPYDGPLEFQEARYSKPGPLPYKSRVHLRWDQSLLYRWPQFAPTQIDYGGWRWEAEYTFGTTTPSGGPRPTTTPGGGDPPPPTTGGGDPGPITPGGGGGGQGNPDRINTAAPAPLYDLGAYQWNEKPSHGTHLETAFPSVVLRAPRVVNGFRNYLHDLETPPDDLVAWQRTSPAVLRTVALSAQGASEPVYTQTPGQGPFPGGTAAGAAIDLPPEVGIEDIGSDFAPEGVSLSRAQRIIGPGVELGFGVPSLDTGGLHDGYLVSHTVADGLRVTRVAAGVETTVLRLRADGVVFLANADGPPSGTPSGGGYLYASGGALLWKGSGGTITTIAPA